MEALDTTLYEEGTQVPLNPHTTSSQVSHKDTTVEKALEDEDLRITGLRKIVIWSNDTSDRIKAKTDRFLASGKDSTALYFNTGTDKAPGTYVALVAQKVGTDWNLMGYYPVNPGSCGFGTEQLNKVIVHTASDGRWIIQTVDGSGKFAVTTPQTLTTVEQNQVKTNIDAGSKAVRINYGNVSAAVAAIEQFNNDPQKTVILVNYKNIRCVATVSFFSNPFIVAYVPERTNVRKLTFQGDAWSETVIYGDTIRYNKQTLTDAQKAQARENINALEDEAGVIDEEHLATGAVTQTKIADGAVTETKIADGSITEDKFSPGLTLYMNRQFNYLKQVQVKYGEDPSDAIKSFAQRDNKTALYIKLTNGLLVPANTNGETVSGLYSYGNTLRKVLFDGAKWSDAEIQNDIIDTAHIKNGAVTAAKLDIELLSRVRHPYSQIPLSDDTVSNRGQLNAFLSSTPDAKVMHCKYKEAYAGTLYNIGRDWYGLLVKNTNNPADNLNIKLSADGTITEGNSAQ